jgi:RNA polymerase sigma-70 factor (ECF subfamily)
MINDRAIAEDLTQETFIKAWKSLSRFDAMKAFKPWLFSIARNTAIDYVRKKQPFSFSSLEDEEDQAFTDSVTDPRPLPSSLLEHKDLGNQLAQALTHLSPVARSIVLMHETEDLTFQEIADALNEPLNTVKSRYRRALLLLQTKLTPNGDPLLPA